MNKIVFYIYVVLIYMIMNITKPLLYIQNTNIIKTTCYRYTEYKFECDYLNNLGYVCEMKFQSNNYSSIHRFNGFQKFNTSFPCYYNIDDEPNIYIKKPKNRLNILYTVIYLIIFTIAILFITFI